MGATLLMSSCLGAKVHTSRTSGINGRTGAHTVFKSQSYYNFESAMRRTDPNKVFILGVGFPKLNKQK